MKENIPTWWEAVLGLAAGFRVWRLLAEDTVLNRPRAWVFGLGDWTSGPPPVGYRGKLADFVTCPWCFGFWVVVAGWLLWLVWPDGTLVLATPFALSAAVGVIAHFLE